MARWSLCVALCCALALAASARNTWYGDHGRSLLQGCSPPDPTCGACVNGQPFQYCCSGGGHMACPTNGNPLPPACGERPLSGITYAPFSTGDNFCLDSATVASDLQKISKLASSIRLYSLTACMDTTKQILQFARQNRMTVAINAYLSKDMNLNNAEVQAAIDLATSYRNVVNHVIVGNEVVFQKTLTADQVCGYINTVRSGLQAKNVNTPCGTADVWPVYESDAGPTLIACSDKVYYNQQPFWEGFYVDCPARTEYACADAPVYTWLKVEGLEKYYKKEFIVTETGWPDMGEKCCDGSRPNAIGGFHAEPSPQNAAYYLQAFVAEARKRGRPYYYHTFEDGDWKRRYSPCGECTGLQKDYNYGNGQTCATHGCEVDYHFGLFNSNRQPKSEFQVFPFCGLGF